MSAQHLNDAVDVVVGVEHGDREAQPALIADNGGRHLAGLQRLAGGRGIGERKRQYRRLGPFRRQRLVAETRQFLLQTIGQRARVRSSTPMSMVLVIPKTRAIMMTTRKM